MAKTESFKTGPVILIYPKLNSPDTYGEGKPLYKTKFKYDNEEKAEKLKTWLKAQAKKLITEVKAHKYPWSVDEETGETIFGPASSQYKPLVVDSKNNKLPGGIMVSGGTVANLELGLNPQTGGKAKGRLALYLNAAMIIKLEEYVRGERQSTFEAVEDGFEVSEEAAAEGADEGFGSESGDEEDAF